MNNEQTIHINLKPELTAAEHAQRDYLHTYVSSAEPYRKANGLSVDWLRKRLVGFKQHVADSATYLHAYIDHLVSLTHEEFSEWVNSEHNVAPKDDL